MIPDLGKYAVWVLSAYGVSIALLIALVALSVAQARRTLATLRRMEEGRAGGARPEASPARPEGARAEGTHHG